MFKMIHKSIVLMLFAWTAVLASPRQVRQTVKTCTCVPYYLCSEGNVVTSGENLLDVRQGGLATPPPEVAALGNPCNTFEICCNAPPEEGVTGGPQPPTTPTPPPIHTPKCGVRNLEGINTRILNPFLGKDESKFAEFPWQAAILRKEGAANIFVCGGTLIGPRFVLTAAHCVSTLLAVNVKVRLGEYDTQSTGEQYPHQDVDASEITKHPEFQQGPLYNDIALIYLAEPAKFAPNIDTACLSKPDAEFPAGKRCITTGWGKSSFGAKGLYSSKLKVVDVPLVPNPQCQDMLRKTRLQRFFVLHPSFLCAGGEKGIDACKGDGGGPLVCEDNGVYDVVGIVAWGIGCGDENVPGVYVKVAKFIPWIEGVMAAKTIA